MVGMLFLLIGAVVLLVAAVFMFAVRKVLARRGINVPVVLIIFGLLVLAAALIFIPFLGIRIV